MTPAPARPSPASTPVRRFSKAGPTLVLLAVAVALGRECHAQGQMFTSLARPRSEIAAEYPYDIRLTASRGAADTSATTSAEVLAPHLGKRPVVLLFWMTTCGPCRRELADLEARLEAWRAEADFAFLPISLDFPMRRGDFHARAGAYPWTSYLDERREFPRVMPGGLNGVPQVFVIDAEGEQVFHRRKYRPGDLDALARALGVPAGS